MTHRLREYRPPTLGLESAGGIELGTVRVYELAACNIITGSLVNAAHSGDGEEERRAHSSGEGFTVGAAAATVARRNRLTSELVIMIEVIEVIDRRSNGLIGYTYLGSIHVKRPDHTPHGTHQRRKQKPRSLQPKKRALALIFESSTLVLFSAPGSARHYTGRQAIDSTTQRTLQPSPG
ncbi:hypothetical protein JB92DRAFT_2832825 [Gautieria morchelliformis]|nr:hypothetical protein JB92DRAFT_2832825 [Gautieria morchelliformis]